MWKNLGALGVIGHDVVKVFTRFSRLSLALRNVYGYESKRGFALGIRNIGIMAHIDAGKTTTTECMLYYSGFINRMGDIDAGTTVMDYLPSEIARGITVQSAAISFTWLNTSVNLIDTPGHVDFTIEVERSLRVLDGAVAIFDASRGVEAQSRTVWRQADRYNVPRIAYINKMDKAGANFALSVQSLQEKLNANTLLLQLPIVRSGRFEGIIDIVTMEMVTWDASDINHKRTDRKFTRRSIHPTDPSWETCIAARFSIIEQLSDLYDDVATIWLEDTNSNDVSSISAELLKQWIRRGTISRQIVPVVCGSSLKNIGVQPLLDAVVQYLPQPSDIQHSFMKYYDDALCAMAFKVLCSNRYGPLIFVRVYSGSIKSGMTLYNPNKSCSEKISKLMSVYANEYKDTKEIKAGGIGIISGFKDTVTGDTLVASKELFETATSKALNEVKKANNEDYTEDQSIWTNVLGVVPIPEPVFFCSVVVNSIIQEKTLGKALEVICREDPSVRIKQCEDGSITLSGMGELHMEIVTTRILEEFKVDAYIGPIQVAYREVPMKEARKKGSYSRTILGKDHHVEVDIHIIPVSEQNTVSHVSNVTYRKHNVNAHAAAIGIVQACQQGNVLGYPLMGAKLKIHSVQANKECPAALITATALQCTRDLFHLAECKLLEPVMQIEVTTNETSVHQILAELNRRHAMVQDVDAQGSTKIILAEAPVAEMKEFASTLRSVTSGNADLVLEMQGYKMVSQERLHKIKLELSGAFS